MSPNKLQAYYTELQRPRRLVLRPPTASGSISNRRYSENGEESHTIEKALESRRMAGIKQRMRSQNGPNEMLITTQDVKESVFEGVGRSLIEPDLKSEMVSENEPITEAKTVAEKLTERVKEKIESNER